MDLDENAPRAIATTNAVNPAIKNTLPKHQLHGRGSGVQAAKASQGESVFRPLGRSAIQRHRHVGFTADSQFALSAGGAFLQRGFYVGLIRTGRGYGNHGPAPEQYRRHPHAGQIESFAHRQCAHMFLPLRDGHRGYPEDRTLGREKALGRKA